MRKEFHMRKEYTIMDSSDSTSLKNAMFDYDDILVKKLVGNSIKSGNNPLDTVDLLTDAMAEIGNRFEKGELFLPDLMLAAKTMKAGMVPLEEEITKRGLQKKLLGKILIGTVFGDIHDIGKNIVATLFNANGFEVIDMGVNVKSEQFIDAVKRHNPDILAMSALLTTTAAEQERVISSLIDAGIRDRIKIMVGGGPITREFAQKIGADGYEPTAPLAVKMAKTFVKKQ